MLTDTPGSPAQRLLITFLAEYQPSIGRPIPSALIVDVLAALGVTADATRTALSRLVRADVLERSRSGRSTSYALSESGQEQVAASTRRILAFGEPLVWDGEWTLIAFSVGDGGNTALRHQLRTRIRPLGFAPVYDGLWCAAHVAPDDARAIVAEVGVDDAMVFRGRLEMTAAGATRLRAAWDVPELESAYRSFIVRFAPLAELVALGDVPPAEALSARIRILDDWRAFPRIDPELPMEILGESWPRTDAYRLFARCYADLAGSADTRLRELVGRFEFA